MQPFYNEVAHTPLFIWDPRAAVQGERRQALVQTIDLAADAAGVLRRSPLPPDMQGRPCARPSPRTHAVREAGLFGMFGGHVNVTDGRYVYMRAPGQRAERARSTSTRSCRRTCAAVRPRGAGRHPLAEPFGFTKGCRTLKIPGRAWPGTGTFETLLFDLASTPASIDRSTCVSPPRGWWSAG